MTTPYFDSQAHIVALSGGKDSTAMALRLQEVEPRDYTYLCTPTGDELPDLLAHWDRLETLLGKPLIRLTNGTLQSWIERFNALPNGRMRWCTRLLKIEPCLAYVKAHQPATLYVGLRADEEERQGIYSELVTTDFPLRRWGWGLTEVWDYLEQRGVKIPLRTDCARCYGQQIGEWFVLWRDHPAIYADAEAQEAATGHTFRRPGRDSWPISLRELRLAFESGRRPKSLPAANQRFQRELFACRVCEL